MLTTVFGIFADTPVNSHVPQWWVERGLVLSADGEASSATIDENYSVANVGQLMNIAKLAADELNDKVSNAGGAGEEITALVSAFPIYNSANPDANYAAVNIGQLKYVSKSFYDRLWEIESAYPNSVTWPTGMIFFSGGTDSTNHKYPWAGMSNPPTTAEYDVNYAVANIGQIKHLFSWSVDVPVFIDRDGDGIDDRWELEHFGSLDTADGESDTDGDGLSDAQEYTLGTDPTNIDSDDDGLSDNEEIILGTNPLKQDSDDDGLSDYIEKNAPRKYTHVVGSFTDPEWIEIAYDGTILTTLTNQDDKAEYVDFGFEFDIYGEKYSGAYASTNGTLSFGTSFSEHSNDQYISGEYPVLSIFWDDLTLANTVGAKVMYKKFADKIVISWINAVIRKDRLTRLTFQVVIEKDGAITYRYRTLFGQSADIRGASATIGMSYGQNNYSLYACNVVDSLAPYMLIKYVPEFTDPSNPDTDGDGMPDGWEVENRLNPLNPNDATLDPDGDGLNNLGEFIAGTNPNLRDTDGDGLDDGIEVANGLDPLTYEWEELQKDHDGDGIPTQWEMYNGLNPFDPSDGILDNDNDGLTNYEEYLYGTYPWSSDSDYDGLNDYDEVIIYNTNPRNSDSDGDGISDNDEVANGLNPLVPLTAQELATDWDNDGLPNSYEITNYLDPFDASDAVKDMDGDGLTALQEYQHGTNPRRSDTDGDGLNDGQEVNVHGTNPSLADSDGDGLSDKFEVDNSLNPLVPLTDAERSADWDNDGIPNGYEIDHGMNIMDVADAATDLDYDGLTNLQEYNLGTNIRKWDTDEDGLSDKQEIDYAAMLKVSAPELSDLIDQYLDPTTATDIHFDYDGDGLSLHEEYMYKTNLFMADTDADGMNDGQEASVGRNPNSNSDAGDDVSQSDVVQVTLKVGDHSSSHSEIYELNVGHINFNSGGYGQVNSRTFPFRKGQSYAITLTHVGTNNPNGVPDYDYTAEVNVEDEESVVHYLKDGEGDNALLRTYQTGTLDTPNTHSGKTATLDLYKFEFITPKQLESEEKITKNNRIKPDLNNPTQYVEGQNAYVFSGEKPPVAARNLALMPPGEFEMDIRMKIFPENHELSDSALNELYRGLIFELEIHDDIKRTWTYSDNLPIWINNGELRAKVKCIGLPPRNSDFGTKTIALKRRGTSLAETKIQLFYRLRGANNPHVRTVPYGNEGVDCLRPVNLSLYYSDAFSLLKFSDDDRFQNELLPDYQILHRFADGYLSRFYRNEFTYTVGIDPDKFDVVFMERNGQEITRTLSYMNMFYYAFKHEEKHMASLREWWGTPEAYAAALNAEEDIDNDCIPDKYEYYMDDATDNMYCDDPSLGYFPYNPLKEIKFMRNTMFTYGPEAYDMYEDFNYYVNSSIPIVEEETFLNDWGCPGIKYNEGE